jgi:hypothetical protein
MAVQMMQRGNAGVHRGEGQLLKKQEESHADGGAPGW